MASGALLIFTCIGLMGLFKFFTNTCKTPNNNNNYNTIDEIPPKYDELDRPPSYSN